MLVNKKQSTVGEYDEIMKALLGIDSFEFTERDVEVLTDRAVKDFEHGANGMTPEELEELISK